MAEKTKIYADRDLWEKAKMVGAYKFGVKKGMMSWITNEALKDWIEKNQFGVMK